MSSLSLKNVTFSDKTLPPIVHTLINTVGFEQALHIITCLGGMSWRFNADDSDSDESQAIILRIGRAAFDALQHQFAGERIYIPKCHSALLALRNQHIHQYLNSGRQRQRCIRELAAQYRLSDRRIAQIACAVSTDLA